MSAQALTSAHRADLEQLTGLASHDLSLIWQQFNDAAVARDGLMDVLPRLVTVYGSAAATLGADWYDEMRTAAEVPGRFSGIAAELPDQGRTDALARWGLGPVFSATPDWSSALVLVSGGLQKIIANADRQSVAISAVADPRAEGWQRQGRGDCHFCDALIGRGWVYTEVSADFASHDHCKCVAVPAFSGKPRPVKDYVPTTRNVTDADRARVRDYMRTH